MNKFINKTISIVSLILVLTFNINFAYAWEVPTSPTPPPAPTSPPVETTATPSSVPTPPPTPTAPPAPTAESYFSPTPSPTPSIKENIEPEETNIQTVYEPVSAVISEEDSSPDNNSLGKEANGNVGDTDIQTGNANNNAVGTTIANTNTADLTTLVDNDNYNSGAVINNEENGSDSTNNGSIGIVDENTTGQNNNAVVGNTLEQSTTTGDNSASKNVGNSTINTGIANTSGTLLNALNTNTAGVTVAEFNIVDDQLGDFVIDYSSGCIIGCSGEVNVSNTGNGNDSTNTADVNQDSLTNMLQNNDAVLVNNMDLSSDSGNNDADKNTGGDSIINTGDANVVANAVNFVNNNIIGNVVMTVVNVFGDLIGDIIFPESALTNGSCSSGNCGTNTTVSNSGNSSDSSNTTSINQSETDTMTQFNNADIVNNISAEATTGNNSTSNNTGGNSSITTGESNVDVNILNIANSNIADGNNWFLVIVNEAGKWIGKILGAPDGQNYYGSEGTQFTVDEYGNVTALNSNNGSGSENTAGIDQSQTTNTTQNNNAQIVNNLNLSANTGGNSASKNTGGNSTITTGDANIVANIVNFVNNNIVGSGKLFVTVVNVFGSWVGDFVSPGQKKVVQQPQPITPNQSTTNENTNSSVITGGSNISVNNNGSSENNIIADSGNTQNPPKNSSKKKSSGTLVSNNTKTGSGDIAVLGTEEQVSQNNVSNTKVPEEETTTVQSQVRNQGIRVNLAWLLVIIPGIYLLGYGFMQYRNWKKYRNIKNLGV